MTDTKFFPMVHEAISRAFPGADKTRLETIKHWSGVIRPWSTRAAVGTVATIHCQPIQQYVFSSNPDPTLRLGVANVPRMSRDCRLLTATDVNTQSE